MAPEGPVPVRRGAAGGGQPRAGPRVRFKHRARALREEAIVEGTLALFAELGCFHLSVDEVAEAVGVSKGTVYSHYASRQELFRGALGRGLDRLREGCQRVMEAAATPAESFRQVIHELLRLNHVRSPGAPASLWRMRCSRAWQALAVGEDDAVEGALIPAVRAWQERGLLDAGADPRWIARAVLALTSSAYVACPPGGEGAAVAPRGAPAAGALDEEAERIAGLLLRGLGARSGPRDGAVRS